MKTKTVKLKPEEQLSFFYTILIILIAVFSIIISNAESYIKLTTEQGIDKDKLIPLTPEGLRKYKGFETVSEEQAVVDIHFIETMGRILFDIYQQENKY